MGKNKPGYIEQWKLDNPDKVKNHSRRQVLKRYSLTEDKYQELLEAQDFRCAICETSPTNIHLSIDHDHKTNIVRGLLCRECNKGIGFLGDDIDRLKKAILYLERYMN